MSSACNSSDLSVTFLSFCCQIWMVMLRGYSQRVTRPAANDRYKSITRVSYLITNSDLCIILIIILCHSRTENDAMYLQFALIFTLTVYQRFIITCLCSLWRLAEVSLQLFVTIDSACFVLSILQLFCSPLSLFSLEFCKISCLSKIKHSTISSMCLLSVALENEV